MGMDGVVNLFGNEVAVGSGVGEDVSFGGAMLGEGDVLLNGSGSEEASGSIVIEDFKMEGTSIDKKVDGVLSTPILDRNLGREIKSEGQADDWNSFFQESSIFSDTDNIYDVLSISSSSSPRSEDDTGMFGDGLKMLGFTTSELEIDNLGDGGMGSLTLANQPASS
ncbi:hypothetical protein BT69DRAFT_1276593 [Atractiella rhizophila]|nr:hypothetical protein BT69DRAFT_1276593 [Atractiella rhizophila]